MATIGMTSADMGSGQTGVNLNAHLTGEPISPGDGVSADITVGHTVFIIFGALALLWFFGAFAFKNVRM